MRLNSHCILCLLEGQKKRIADFPEAEKKTAYMKEICKVIGESEEQDSAPYMVYLFDQIYDKYFGLTDAYLEIKQDFNRYVMDMEEQLYAEILQAEDPLKRAIVYARIGNYIDFGTMLKVEKEQFLELFHEEEKNLLDEVTYQEFLQDCETGKEFVLVTDNCGEIVLDMLFLKILQERFPQLHIQVLMRGKPVLNDATIEDAKMIGLCEAFTVLGNGNAVAGTVEKCLSEEARQVLDSADFVLAKGQGNFETMNGTNRNVYYSFLCKCDWFAKRFQVPRFTGMFLHEPI